MGGRKWGRGSERCSRPSSERSQEKGTAGLEVGISEPKRELESAFQKEEVMASLCPLRGRRKSAQTVGPSDVGERRSVSALQVSSTAGTARPGRPWQR